MKKFFALFLVSLLGSSALAYTEVCANNLCFRCTGSSSINNDEYTCDGTYYQISPREVYGAQGTYQNRDQQQRSRKKEISGGILNGNYNLSGYTMNGGIIQGDAVLNGPAASFIMNGGIITGSVYCHGGKVVQRGGIIEGRLYNCN